MFKLTLDTPIPSVEETVSILQRHVDMYGVPLDYDRMQEYTAYYTLRKNAYLQRIIRYTGSIKTYKDYTDEDFVEFLKKVNAVDLLGKTSKGRYSVSGESLDEAMASGTLSEEVMKLMNLYKEVKSAVMTIGPFKAIFDKYPVANWETFDNHRLIVAHPVAVPQNTGRVGYQAPAITNFKRVVQDIITAPKGWVKCEADSGQIDPRISQSWVIKDPQLIKCTNMYNDAYFGYVHYCNYLTDNQRATGDLNLAPVEMTDEQKEKRKKFKTFGNAVMYGSTENVLGDPDKANFIKYIGGHPARIKLQQEAENAILRGDTIFKTAFGTPIDIMAGPSALEDKKYSEREQFNRRVKRAINNPIQGTAADLFRYSVSKADKLLMRKAPNSCIIAYVHDSGKFMIAEDEYDDVINDIKEIVSYQVEDWIPIYGDYEEGVHKSDVQRFIV